jgi:hypothetical protein
MADWTEIEVELIIADYFQMLAEELKGGGVNKTQHRRYLQKLLNNRSEGSIEFKHQNISAVLVNLGQPFISGYKPRYNYQKILEDKVIEYLSGNRFLELNFKDFSEREVKGKPAVAAFSTILVDPPKPEVVKEPNISYTRKPIKVNYLEREQRNSSLGEAGEQLIVEYEKWKLRSLGKDALAEKVEWISKEQGDGAGFDILSKDQNGRDKYIEVKTTKLSKEAPFYFTKNELDFSLDQPGKYHLYRVFNFEKGAKFFIKQGSLNSICQYQPISFKGYF